MKGRTNAQARRISNELRIIRRSIASLDHAVRRLGPILRTIASTNGHPAGTDNRRRSNLSSQQLAALKLQGRYMGFIRQLSAKQKGEVRSVRSRRGIEAAIKRAHQFLRG